MTTLVLSILNGSSSFLHTIRTTIKAWMSLNFRKILSLTWELAALELSICLPARPPARLPACHMNMNVGYIQAQHGVGYSYIDENPMLS